MFTAARGGFNYLVDSANDPYWTSVSLLINNETPQTAFVDNSTNNFALTITGASTTPIKSNLRTPFANGSGASMYWDGTASWIEMPANAAWSLGTGNFTFEAWVYVTNFSVNFGGYMPIIGWGGGSYKIFRVRPTAFNFQAPNISGDYNANWPSTMVINTWYHVALVRTSTTSVTAYLNGVAGTPTTISASAQFGNATDVVQVGYKSDPGYWWGYMSNWRLVKGTAVYTGNFTPSTSPLTAISGTSGLLNFTNQGQQRAIASALPITDQGPNAFAITTSASIPVMYGLSPFGNTYPGSVNFVRASSQYLQVATNAAFTYGTGTFTIECWVYLTTIGVTQYIIDQRNSGTATANIPTLYIDSSNQVVYYVNGSAIIQGGSLTTNTWYHIAVCRSGLTKLFVNGTSVGTPVFNTTNFAASRVTIGSQGDTLGNYFSGYISNVRLSKGIDYYSGNFTPSTIPLTVSATYTSLYISANNNNVYDLSNVGNRVSGGLVQTQYYKFGTQGINPNSAAITILYNSNLNFGTGDFTVEGWFYCNAVGTTQSIIYKGVTNPIWGVQINSSNKLIFNVNSSTIITGTTSVSATTWTYFAVTRSGTTNYLFLNGNLENTATDSTNFTGTDAVRLGTTGNGLGTVFSGYMDDIRVTTGVCRYTSSFTAPTTAFQTS